MRKDGHTAPLATLNGTLCAMPRIIVALLENHQQADGSVSFPPLCSLPGADQFCERSPHRCRPAHRLDAQLIALDIDDTLTVHLGEMKPRVIDAIAAVRAQGVEVVLATGRAFDTTTPVARCRPQGVRGVQQRRHPR